MERYIVQVQGFEPGDQDMWRTVASFPDTVAADKEMAFQAERNAVSREERERFCWQSRAVRVVDSFDGITVGYQKNVY